MMNKNRTSHLLAIHEERPWDLTPLNPLPGVRQALHLTRRAEPRLCLLSMDSRAPTRADRLRTHLNKFACVRVDQVTPPTTFESADLEPLHTLVEQADLIWLDEGEPNLLLSFLARTGLSVTILRRWTDGVIIVGSGGGALACFQGGLRHDESLGWDASIGGLNLAHALLHLASRHTRVTSLHQEERAYLEQHVGNENLFSLAPGGGLLIPQIDGPIEAFGRRGAIIGTAYYSGSEASTPIAPERFDIWPI